MNRVFLLEKPRQGFDLSSALRFGTAVMLYDHVADRRPSPHGQAFGARVIAALEHHGYDPRKDLICVVGNMAAMVLMTAFVIIRYGCVRVLIFDNVNEQYSERIIDANTLAQEGAQCLRSGTRSI